VKTFNFKETNSKISLQKNINQSFINPISSAVDFDDYKNTNNLFKNLIYDQSSIQKLESLIRKIISNHQDILSQANLPDQINIEFLRISRISQLKHYFSKDKVNEPYANSSQERSYSLESPIIRIATDFVKDSSNENYAKFGHKFLDTLRDNFADFNKEKTKKIITELTFLHELGHIIFNSKIKHTFLKYGYEVSGEKLATFKRIARLINEGFSDGISAYITNLDFPNDNVIENYKSVRYTTKKELENNISYYNVSEIFNKLNGISKVKLIDDIFDIALQNGLNVVQEGINKYPIFEKKLKADLKILHNKNIFIYDENKTIMKNLEDNIHQQLKEQFSPLFIRPQEKLKVSNNIISTLNRFRVNNSEQKNKPKIK
jgi:hypothetical protein